MGQFGPYVDSWTIALEAENKSPRTVETYAEGMMMFARWVDSHNDVPAAPPVIEPVHCRRFLAPLSEERTPATARNRWTAPRRFYAWMVEEGEVATSPMGVVKPPMVPEKTAEMLTLEQLKDLLAVCEGPRLVGRRDLALILPYADTGARLSEIARLQVDDVDVRERTVKVLQKGRRERVLPFGARMPGRWTGTCGSGVGSQRRTCSRCGGRERTGGVVG